jgi:hypothetical protein
LASPFGNDLTLKSDKIIYCFFKYLFLAIGLLFHAVSVRLVISLGLVSGSLQEDWVQILPLILMGLGGVGCVVTFLILRSKLVLVEIKDSFIIISKNGDRRTVNWTSIAEISQIQFVHPSLVSSSSPIY